MNLGQEYRSRKHQILWFVSNCRSRTKRHQIAEEINKHFPIDQYGQCSYFNRTRKRIPSKSFEPTLSQYKFYLAFENTNFQDYITEKAFYNALAHGRILVVLGATN